MSRRPRSRLLALQGRRDQDAVKKSLAYLAAHCLDERSGLSLSLSRIALAVFGHVGHVEPGLQSRRLSEIDAALAETWETTGYLGNIPAIALAVYAEAGAEEKPCRVPHLSRLREHVGQGFSPAGPLTRRDFLATAATRNRSRRRSVPPPPALERRRLRPAARHLRRPAVGRSQLRRGSVRRRSAAACAS